MVQDTDEPHTEPNNPDVEGEILSRVDLFKKERSELLPLIKEVSACVLVVVMIFVD